MNDLLKLAERVEAGEDTTMEDLMLILNKTFDAVWRWKQQYGNPLTSQDAAQALHDAVLPGWGVNLEFEDNHANCEVYSIRGKGRGNASAPTAAWVAAILRAKAQENE